MITIIAEDVIVSEGDVSKLALFIMNWQPSIDELIPIDMSYASVHETPEHCDLYVVDLDTQEVMDDVQSVDIKKGVAYCIVKDAIKAMPIFGRYQIYVMSDCQHGFVVRDVQKDYRFQCKECNTRFRSYPQIRIKSCL